MLKYLDEDGLKQLWDKIPHRIFFKSMDDDDPSYYLHSIVIYPCIFSGRRVITGNGTNVVTFMTMDELKSDIPLLYDKAAETKANSLWCSLVSVGSPSEAYVISTLIENEKISAVFNKDTYKGGLYQVRALITA